MIITFNRVSIDYPFFVPGTIKFYRVPTAYSEDGYYAAIWKNGDLEPVPASCSQETTLLAHVDMTGTPLQPILRHLENGVTYAEN